MFNFLKIGEAYKAYFWLITKKMGMIVDCSGGWATPRGLALQMRPWSE